MPEQKDEMGIKDKIHIVLTGPNGEIKDEREAEDEATEEPRIS